MPEAKADLDFWIKSGDKPVIKKITQLLESVSTTPYEGIGKPEPCKVQSYGLLVASN
jgi:toxin YoeB